MSERNAYWVEFKPTKINKLLFLELVVSTRAKVACFHQGKRAKWSIEFPFTNEIAIFKQTNIFTIEDMPIAVLR